MSFWGDIKRASSATVGALNSAVEAAADAAEILDGSVKVVAVRSRIMRLEGELERSDLGSLSSFELAEKREELLLKYEELARFVAGVDSEEALLKKARLLSEMRDESSENLVDSINSVLSRIDLTDFSLPVDEIRERKVLLGDIDRLIGILKLSDSRDLIGWARQLRETIVAKIGLLEKRRKVEFHGEYPSGVRLCCVERYDGRPHGVSRYWYESGVLKTEANFSQGVLCGRSKHWCEDGSLMVDSCFDPGRGASEVSVFLKDGSRIVHAEFSKGVGFADVWLWDGTYAGRAYKHGDGFGRPGFILRVLLKPKVWGALWRARKEGFYRQGIEYMDDVIENSFCFFDELERMQFRG